MRSLLMTPFRLFREDKPLRNTVILFVLTTLFYAMGATLRLVEELSLFWPLNAVMAGVFARHTFLNRLNNYVVCYVAMVLYDGLTTNWGTASFIINFSNIVFILTFALLVQRDKRRPKRATALANTLKMFNYCLLASVLCACFGAVGSSGIDSQTFWPLFADWFSDQTVSCSASVTASAAGGGAGVLGGNIGPDRRRGKSGVSAAGADLVCGPLLAADDGVTDAGDRGCGNHADGQFDH